MTPGDAPGVLEGANNNNVRILIYKLIYFTPLLLICFLGSSQANLAKGLFLF